MASGDDAACALIPSDWDLNRHERRSVDSATLFALLLLFLFPVRFSMAVWFVQRENDEIGPLRPAELLALVRDGSVQSNTQLRKDDSSWFAASEVGGLFEAARRPTIEHFCPHCHNVRVSSPPTTCPKCDQTLTKTRQKIIEHSLDNPSSQTSQASPQGPAASARRWLQKRVRKDESSGS